MHFSPQGLCASALSALANPVPSLLEFWGCPSHPCTNPPFVQVGLSPPVPNALALTKDNIYKVKVTGSLTMHGVTKPVSALAIITIKGGTISASASFTVAAEDYKIRIPALVADKISRQITVTADVPAYQNLK